MKLFDLDGPVYRVGTEIADFLILSLYWIICCLPIITIGASTSSLFYVFGKKVRGEDTYITKDFFKSFKQNFKQSVPLTIIILLLWASVLSYYIIILGYQGQAPFYLLVISVIFIVEVILFTIYSLAILSRFYMKLSQVILTSFILAHRHLLTSFLIVAGALAIEFTTTLMPVLFFLSPVILIIFSSMLLQKIFTIHIDAAEELKKEKENQADEDSSDDEYEADEEIADEEIEDDSTEVYENENNTLDSGDNHTGSEEDKDFLKYI